MYKHSQILQSLVCHASANPQKVAIIVGSTEVSYTDLLLNAQKAAGILAAMGIGSGQRIVLSAHKDIEFVYLYLGAHILGVTNVIVDAESNEERLRYIEDKKILLNNYCDYSMSLRNKIVKYLQPYFDLVELHYNTKKPSINNWAYINYLQVQNLILLPKLGIVEDEQALNQFQKIFPDKQIEQVDTSELVPNGGALNCISWNIKY